MATTMAHELQLGDGNPLSVEYLFWGAKQVDGLASENYTTVPAVKRALLSPGQPEESFWLYDPTLAWPSTDYKPPQGTPPLFQRSSDSRKCCPGEVRDAIDTAFVPIIVLRVTNGFYTPVEGRVALESDDKPIPGLRHAVAVVGTGSNEQGSRFVVIQNSWGADWGIDGYGLLEEDYLDAWLAAVFVVN